jgi:hypothetical protein
MIIRGRLKNVSLDSLWGKKRYTASRKSRTSFLVFVGSVCGKMQSSKLQTSAALLQRAPNRQLLRAESVQIVWAVSKYRSASL